MSLNIERSSRTDGDLFEIALFIGEDNPKAAGRFLDAAEATFKQLAAMPGMGRPRKFRNSRLSNLRSWRVEGFENYLVFYTPAAPAYSMRILRAIGGNPAPNPTTCQP